MLSLKMSMRNNPYQHSKYDPSGVALNEIGLETNYLLTCVCYIVILFFLWYFVKVNFILNHRVNPKLRRDCKSSFTNFTDTVDATDAVGASGWYSKGKKVQLKESDGSEFGETNPQMVKESIWGTAANWGDAEKYKTKQPKTSTLGYNYANHIDMYGDTSDLTQTSQAGSFASDSEFSGSTQLGSRATSQVVDWAGRDGYAGGRGLSHREGLDNPDGDVDGDFGMYDIYATRTNTPSQPLTASQSAGRMADATGKVSIMSGPSYGMYGDVPVALYNTADTATGDEWGLGSDKLYRMNSYTWNEDKNY